MTSANPASQPQASHHQHLQTVQTVTCGLSALYIADDASTLNVDIADIFGGITPNPTSSSRCIPSLNTAINDDTVYYAWEWSGMSWPDRSNDSSAGFSV